MKPIVRINTELPEIGIPDDPIVLFFQNEVLLCYELSPSDGFFAVLLFENPIQYSVTPINDEGIGNHRFAKNGLTWYTIHEITNIEETNKWKVLNPIYWVFTFKDRTFELLGREPKVLEANCRIDDAKARINSFLKI